MIYIFVFTLTITDFLKIFLLLDFLEALSEPWKNEPLISENEVGLSLSLCQFYERISLLTR